MAMRMRGTRFAAALAGCLLGGFMGGGVSAVHAASESPDCLEAATLEDYLRAAYQEQVSAMGDHDNGHRMFLYTSSGGTWTLVELRNDGVACVAASGTGWHAETEGMATFRLRGTTVQKPPA